MTPIGFAFPTRSRALPRISDWAKRPTSPAPSSPSTERSRPERPRHEQGYRACTAPASRSMRLRCSGTSPGLGPSARARWRAWPRPRPRCAGLCGQLAPATASSVPLPRGVSEQRPMPARPLHALWRRTSPPARVVRRAGRRGAWDQLRRPPDKPTPPRWCRCTISPRAPSRAVQPRRRWPIPDSYPGGRCVAVHGCTPIPAVRCRRGGGGLRGRPRPGANRGPRGARPTRRGRRGSGRRAGVSLLPKSATRYCLAIGTAEPRKDLPGLVRAFVAVGAPARRRRPGAGRTRGVGGRRAPQRALDVAPRARCTASARGGSNHSQLAASLRGAVGCWPIPRATWRFGFPPLQAMEAGVPVVATKVGSLPEVLGDGAWLAAARGSGRAWRCSCRVPR